MWLMLQQEKPEDFVITTGTTTRVREFVRMAFAELGIKISFLGEGIDEIGIVEACHNSNYLITLGKVIVKVDERYFRPTEIELLIGNPKKANTKLGWIPKYNLKSLVKDMVQSDLAFYEKDQLKQLQYK